MNFKRSKLALVLASSALLAGLPVFVLACTSPTSATSTITPQNQSDLIKNVKTKLGNLQADVDQSTHDDVKWKNVVSFSFLLQNNLRLEYSTAKTVQLANSTKTWVNALPSAFNSTPTERYLWARLTSSNDSRAKAEYLDLTTSTSIANVKTKLDTLTELVNTDLSLISLSGSYDAAVIKGLPNTNAVEALFNINDGEWLSAEAFIAHLAALKPTKSLIETIKVKLKAVDTDKTVLFDERIASPNVSDLRGFGELLSYDNIVELIRATKVLSGSTNLQTDFTPLPSRQQLNRSNMRLDFRTAAVTEQNPITDASAWTDTIPSSFSFVASERFFWIRVSPRQSATWDPIVIDLSDSSGVRNIITLLNEDPFVKDFDLTKVKLVNDEYGIPYVELESGVSESLAKRQLYLEFNTGANAESTWGDVSVILPYFVLNKTIDDFSAATFTNIKARLALLPSASTETYVFNKLGESSIDTSGLKPLNLLTARERLSMMASLIKLDFVNSTIRNLKWITPVNLALMTPPNWDVRYRLFTPGENDLYNKNVPPYYSSFRGFTGLFNSLPEYLEFTSIFTERYLVIFFRPDSANSWDSPFWAKPMYFDFSKVRKA